MACGICFGILHITFAKVHHLEPQEIKQDDGYEGQALRIKAGHQEAAVLVGHSMGHCPVYAKSAYNQPAAP